MEKSPKKVKRASTWMERSGFRDIQLKTSEHDKIMFWVDEYVSRNSLLMKEITETQGLQNFVFINSEWEHVIGSQYIYGFIDHISIWGLGKYEKWNHISDESYYEHYICVCCEIKTNIESFGDIIRELQFYREKTTFPYKLSNMKLFSANNNKYIKEDSQNFPNSLSCTEYNEFINEIKNRCECIFGLVSPKIEGIKELLLKHSFFYIEYPENLSEQKKENKIDNSLTRFIKVK
jgi:hypothetical protein